MSGRISGSFKCDFRDHSYTQDWWPLQIKCQLHVDWVCISTSQRRINPVWSRISDIFGRKPMPLLANVIFMVGSLLCAVSNNIDMLIVGRAVQGLGGGGLTIVVEIFIGYISLLNIRSIFYGVLLQLTDLSASTRKFPPWL